MDIYQVAQEMRPIVYQAGEIAKKYFLNVKAERKADHSFVTKADREVETFLKEEIHRLFPDHGVLGEEFGQHQLEDAESVWAIDPIDGTAPFVYELPVWGVSVGLLHKRQGVLGFVYLPVMDEMYWAVAGGPAFVNEREIQVCEPLEMVRGTCIVAPSITFRGLDAQYQGRALSFGSAAAHICYVARGKIHGGVLMKVRLWDIAAAAVVLEVAGGELLYLSGDPVDLGELLDGSRVREPFCIGCSENARQLTKLFKDIE
ncbi:MAG: inositol monophosphatase family protein [Candidatus Hinthialibacter sp.]